ncbi:RtcB family protein [Candidatus Pacearchaeota archaeon]|nr:RtcB family protein [Candidatus Pacearchaeota archaeon]
MKTKEIYNYAIDVDKETLEQFKNCYSEKFVVAAALMPDAHLGYAAPIGAVLKTKGFIVPAWVGFDIGCGLIALRIKGKKLIERVGENQDRIYSQVMRKIPMGVGSYNKPEKITEKTKKDFKKILEKFEKKPHDKNVLNYLKTTAIRHLGTLGGGNHFIELGTDEQGDTPFAKPPKKKNSEELWLIIHSGSRGIGHNVAKKYMISASGSREKTKYEKTFPLDSNSEIGKEYLNVLEFGLDYALLNRLEIAYQIIEILKGVLQEDLKYEIWVNKNHNHAIYENGFFIHRKGATPAKKNERGIIPGNMRDGSFLVVGKGNGKFLNSSSHGAGRSMSRKKAREKYTMEQFKESMKGIKGTISNKTLDELPMAYKNISEVMEAQKESIKIIKHIKPMINWKGE